jgi:hypothetical protein
VLSATAKRIHGYAGRDAVMTDLVAELESEGQQFSGPVAARMLKEVHFASANLARSRDAMGKSRKER